MKLELIAILIFVTTTGFSQSIESIDKLVSEIERTNFIDTITIYDQPEVSTRPIQITAYLNGDTLLKTVARYSNSTRLKYSYYDKFENTPLFVKDIDSSTSKILLEVYGKDFEVYKASIKMPLEKQEIKQPYRVLDNSDFSTEIAFAIVDRQALKYKFIGKLVDTVPAPPGCGIFAFAIVNKFEVISTTYTNYDKKYVLIIQPCPNFLGEHFFIKGENYEIDVATNNGVTFGYLVFNNFINENLPIFWTREIKKIEY